MTYLVLKFLITSIIIVAVSEIAKHSSFFGSILASIPLVSVLAITWLYLDTKDVSRVIDLSNGILWLVIPSLTFFVILPVLLKYGISFYISLSFSIVATIISYYSLIKVLNKFGIEI